MKSYTLREINQINRKINDEKAELENKLSCLQESRKGMKLFDFKAKSVADREIEDINLQLTCYSYLLLMLSLYEDSMNPETEKLSDEKILKYENRAMEGSAIDKLMVFCHKCFVEHTITQRDIKRLELEAQEGDEASEMILFAYNLLFAD